MFMDKKSDEKDEELQKVEEKLEKKNKMSPLRRVLLCIYFVLLVPTTLYFLIATWPVSSTGIDPGQVEYFHGWLTISLCLETRVLLLVILSGILGAFIHFGTSYIFFAGRNELLKNFTVWYILRPLIGAALAVITYFVFRGVLFSADTDLSNINLYGMLAIAGLVGMFSKQAIEKLRQVFDDLFMKVKDIEKGE